MREAIACVKRERVLAVLQLTDRALRKLNRNMRIAVSGLNPHAGEGGAFGREEIEQIAPAVEAAREAGIDAHGPLPPDTIFMKALAGDYGAVICMYHDQGHIAMKLHGFGATVNVTVGLPIVRTSVDHGTAFDIAYQGVAGTENFVAAFDMAARLAQGDDA
jgi:4-hydroxythreonine-4-phosphate dehydrogenase